MLLNTTGINELEEKITKIVSLNNQLKIDNKKINRTN